MTAACRDSAQGAAPFEAPFDSHAFFAGEDLDCVRGEARVFEGLSFRLEAGGLLLLEGPNGSGKSSLLRLAAGLLAPERGRLSWHDLVPVDEAEAHAARLHYVGHLDAVKPVFSVRENLSFWLGLSGVRSQARARASDHALGAMGLSALADLPARYLSAGQRRRLALARLVARPAPLWLLDEPLAALDAEAEGRFWRLMAGHRARGGMAMMATHQAPPPAEPGAADHHRLALADHAPRESA